MIRVFPRIDMNWHPNGCFKRPGWSLHSIHEVSQHQQTLMDGSDKPKKGTNETIWVCVCQAWSWLRQSLRLTHCILQKWRFCATGSKARVLLTRSSHITQLFLKCIREKFWRRSSCNWNTPVSNDKVRKSRGSTEFYPGATRITGLPNATSGTWVLNGCRMDRFFCNDLFWNLRRFMHDQIKWWHYKWSVLDVQYTLRIIACMFRKWKM